MNEIFPIENIKENKCSRGRLRFKAFGGTEKVYQCSTWDQSECVYYEKINITSENLLIHEPTWMCRHARKGPNRFSSNECTNSSATRDADIEGAIDDI